MQPELADSLEVIAHGVTAILATWLGLIVITRARRQPGAPVFAALTLYLVVWSVAIIVQRLTSDPTIHRPVRAAEDMAAFILPAATLHIALAMTVEGRRSQIQQAALVAAYAVCGTLAMAAAIFPDQKLAVTPPHFEALGVSGAVWGWAWIAARIAIFGVAIYWIVRALRASGDDIARRRQLQATLATVSVGALGGVLRIVPQTADDTPFIGVSLVTVAVVLAAYAVFAQGIFLSSRVAGQAFRYSVVIGLVITLYVGALVGLEWISSRVLAIELPIVTGLALVVSIALFDPVAGWVRSALRGRSAEQTAYDRLLRALGQDLLTTQRPEGAVAPALARLSRTFRLTGAAVIGTDDAVLATHGHPSADSPLAVRLPLNSHGTDLGTAVFGPKKTQLPFGPHEEGPLSLAAGYLAASLRLAQRHVAEVEALQSLQDEAAAVETRGSALSQALVEEPSAGLQVYALGPLRVERDGSLITRWGGAKAGTRQAEAVFAFLFDRGDRGAAKDEIIELIWPDVDLERADLAFHRTLGGLRTTLEPGRGGGNRGGAISFHNDRYRLDRSVVAWSDLSAFEDAMSDASATADPDLALQHLERARSLYRGDFLDDCPFYGDSAQVEDRRELLRGRYVDLLMALGERYERRGDRPAAAACFRQARLAAGDELATADEALARLGATT